MIRATISSCLASLLLVTACVEHSDPTAAAGKRRVAVIPKGTTHEFWKSIHAGARKAEQELGVEVIWKGPKREDDRDEQIKVVENYIAKHVDGIVLAPLDNTALVPVVKEAVSQGIPVVIADSGIEWDGMVSFVATDNYKGGVLAAQHLGKILGGKGKALMMRYQEGSASTMEREAGFLETMQKEFAQIELVSHDQYAGPTTETALRKGENLLLNHKELDGIFCPNESSTFGMLRALQDSGRAGRVHFVGFDSSDKLMQALHDGQIDGLVLQDPFRMGELGVKAIVDHLDKKPVEKRIDTGVHVATRNNMEQPEIKALLKPDLSKWLKE
ncbi:MAG: substrate-binding domain-containing protein [Planctomycetota bacterium]